MRRTARQIAEVLGAESMDEDEVSKVWVASQSKDWISAGFEVGLPLFMTPPGFRPLVITAWRSRRLAQSQSPSSA